jgi:type IV secretory pathway VirB3-like protein
MNIDRPQDYCIKVHRSLLKRDLIAGISKLAIIIIFVLTVILSIGFRQFWFIGVGVILYIVFRICTKKDEYLVEIVMNSLFKPDELIP